MDITPTAIDIIMNATNRFESIRTIQYALEAWKPEVSQEILTKHLVDCEYSTNSQVIALATIPEEGESENLFINMNLNILTNLEILFLKEVFEVILSLCPDYKIKTPDVLTKDIIFQFTQLEDPIFLEQILEKYGLHKFNIDDLIKVGLEPTASNILNQITTNIFTNAEFPKYVSQYFVQDDNCRPGKEPDDVLTSERVVNFKRFIGIIAKKLKYGKDADKVVEADETLLMKTSPHDEFSIPINA